MDGLCFKSEPNEINAVLTLRLGFNTVFFGYKVDDDSLKEYTLLSSEALIQKTNRYLEMGYRYVRIY